MLFDQCCQLLMRMVSPQSVGLILFCLIGGLSAVLPPQRAHPNLHRESFSSHRHSHPFLSTESKRRSSMEQDTSVERLSENSNIDGAINSTTGQVAISFNTPRGVGGAKPPIKLRVYAANGVQEVRLTTKSPNVGPSVINTQIVYTVADLIKFLRDTKRRISLESKENAKGYLERKSSSTPLNHDGINDSTHQDASETNLKTESLDKLRGVRKRNSLYKDKHSNATDQILQKGRTSGNKSSGTVTVASKPLVSNFRTRKSRSGRNFVTSGLRDGRETKLAALDLPVSSKDGINNKTSTIRRTMPKPLFNYTYHMSAVERGSVFPHDPLDEFEGFDRKGLFPSPYIIPYMGNKTILNSEITPSKSETIYESLKPRLRTRVSPNGDNFWHQKLANFNPLRQQQQNETQARVKIRTNANFPKLNPTVEAIVIKTGEDNNSLSNVNKTRVSKYRSLHVPKRMDSKYESNSTLTHQKSTVEPPTIATFDISNYYTTDPSQINEVVTEINDFLIPSGNTHYPQHSNQNSSELASTNETAIDASTPPGVQLEGSDKISELQNLNTTRILRIETNNTSVKDSPDSEVTELYEYDVRQPKMTGTSDNSENVPYKKPKLDQKSFYDYLMKAYAGNATRNFSIPEYRPGNLFRYDDLFPRKPVLDIYFPRPTPFFKVRTSPSSPVTPIPDTTTTPFESRRTSIRVSSTFYPNRMQDVTMRFGPDPPTTPTPILSGEEDESEFRDEAGFTMEKLAYLLIGTCCGLSILCLCVVIAAIKCRRVLVEKRLRAQFRSRLYHNEQLKDGGPWQQHQVLDHFAYLNRNLDGSRSSAGSCNCHCVTWSLGARNLEPPSRQDSRYLCGQKRLPFGAASTLRYESMLGRKRHPEKPDSSNTDSSQENDSLEQDSDSRDSGDGGPRNCTCISYAMWPMQAADGRRAMYGLCSTAGHYVAGDCSHQPLERLHTIPKNCPPPVTGSNYLDRSEGVVYWSSNDERLI